MPQVEAVNHRKVAVAMSELRLDVCRGAAHRLKNNAVAPGGHEMPTGITRRRAGTGTDDQVEANATTVGDSGSVSARNEAHSDPVDITVMVLSAIDGREDIAQMTRRLATNATAATSEGDRGVRPGSKVNEQLVGAHLDGNDVYSMCSVFEYTSLVHSHSCSR